MSRNIFVTPIIMATKRTKGGAKFKGGVTTYRNVKKEIWLLLRDTSVVAVISCPSGATMIDYYGLPDDFPGKDSLQGQTCFQRVAYLEKAFQNDINQRKFIPYLALHEFEALLFAAPATIAAAFPGTTIENALLAIINNYHSPEEINDGPKSHPAARLLTLLPSYHKALHAPLIARRIGLDRIRGACSHFDQWLTKLESLG
jgi:hypothetical protein